MIASNIVKISRNSISCLENFSIDVVAVELYHLEEDPSWLVSELFCSPRANFGIEERKCNETRDDKIRTGFVIKECVMLNKSIPLNLPASLGA